MTARKWKVDAEGERARRYSDFDRAAVWAVELAREGKVAVIVESPGWANFTVEASASGDGTRCAGAFAHHHATTMHRLWRAANDG